MGRWVSPIIGAVGWGILRPVRGLRVIVKCGGNIMRQVVATRVCVCAISNMMCCGHMSCSVFKRDALYGQGMQIGAERKTLRRAAGAWGVVLGVGRCVAGL